MSQVSFIRLKIQINSEDLELVRGIEVKFWIYLDLAQIKTIEALKREILTRIFIEKSAYCNKKKLPCINSSKFSSVKLSLDNYELPQNESSRILRDLDIVVVHLMQQNKENKINNQVNNKKRKQIIEPTVIEKHRNQSESQSLNSNSKKSRFIQTEDWDCELTQPTKSLNSENYVACVIGTSMVKHFNVKDIFPNQKCFFKSVSGGLIKSIRQILESRSLLLKNCKIFVITVGSNDMDSKQGVQNGINEFLKLAKYLKSEYKDGKFVINKLIPRTRTKHIELADFEQCRIQFNNFLENELKFLDDYVIVSHKKFEEKAALNTLLSDGVHLSPTHGVSLYVEEIKKSLQGI